MLAMVVEHIFFPRDAPTHAVGMYGPYRSNAIATRRECSKQNVWHELKETGTSFDFIATPLWHSVEFRSAALENSFEFRIGEVSLEIATIHVSRQPVVGDNK
jgi:hypothetical protein